MKLFKEILKNNVKGFIISFLLIGLAVGAQLIQPKVMANIINDIASGNIEKLNIYGFILLALAVVGIVAGILNTLLAAKIAQDTGKQLRTRVFNKVQEFSYSNIEKFSASNLVVRLTNDTQQAQSLVMIMLQALTRIPVMFIGSFVLAMMTLPSLWWLVVLVMILVVVAVGLSFGMMGPKFGVIQKSIEKINAIAKENFLGMRVVKSFVQEDSEIDKFSKESAILTKETIGVGYVFGVLMPFFFLIMDGSIVVIIYMVSKRSGIDPEIIGASTSFISYLVMIMMALMFGGMMVSFSSRAFVSLKRIEEVLDTEIDMMFVENGKSVTTGDIEFEHVSFTYDDTEFGSLHDVSFKLKAGQTMGIVGATGCGKSTLIQLIARIFDTDEGVVRIGGEDIKEVSEVELKKHVSLVLQRPVLLSGTIASNIRQGKLDATDEEVMKAAKIAQAHDFIMNESGQYDAEVYQRGSNFSGGQKQRISIARGIVSDPKILILDDSTSALDAKSEMKVKEAIMNELNDVTKVIISQKISSITHADLILVMDEGRIVDEGTHKDLLGRSKLYQEIYETQKDKSKNRLFEESEDIE